MKNPLARILAGCLQLPQADAGLQKLAELLDTPLDELAAAATNPRLCYRPFAVRKRDGGKRQIVAPSEPLKRLQRRLLRRYLAQQPLHDAATAFRPGQSIVTHARRHLGQAIVLTVDLANFFPSTAARRVRRWYREQGWEGAALEVLMRLSVYRGGLPQGAPTSPALSNLVNRELDEELSELAGIHSARYSRYCDDLAFSWATDVEPPAFRRLVEDRLGRFEYRIQPAKSWRLQRAAERPEITGLALDGRRLRLSDRIVQRIRRLRSRRFTGDASLLRQLQGYWGLRKMLK
ncbi:MAG TPA: reverse transcriptase family protein [Pirellulales bacterium]|nr:reverse transcriptase family protein [Pirellulales bacterium]